ncbi:MAG TPA: aldo/keto reductase [Pirellulales bacterium]|jgi:predicted aldo/keto reductase-like oxidoreductase|nr:aldo/keto reductase [Pirellulales bacterium]
MRRRDFLFTATVAAGTPLVVGEAGLQAAEPAPLTAGRQDDVVRGEMRYRKLGRTGEVISCIGVGGFHIGTQKDEQESIRIIRRAIDSGINFLDNCWDYNNGQSELRMGKALADGYRGKAFLMTKFDGRTKKLAAQQIDESLKRLGTDHVDLMQYHEVIRLEDPDRFFGEDGAGEALLAAQKAGKTRFLGFTGHKDPAVHLRMLAQAKERGFHFDAVQLPVNAMDAHFRSFTREVVPELVRQEIGVLGMKPLASGDILKSNTLSAIECLHYALSMPTSVVITGMDSMKILDQALEAVRTFRPLDEEQIAKLLTRTEKAAAQGRFERFKTDARFDATARNPAWIG